MTSDIQDRHAENQDAQASVEKTLKSATAPAQSSPAKAPPPSDVSKLDKVRLLLLRGRTWRYLRYLHFRQYISEIAPEIETVCVCGSGHGLAELAVALEFPHLRFTLTDIIGRGYPNYHMAMDLSWIWGVNNMAFSVWNVMQSTQRRFDLVCSTEMLEHIKDDNTAVANMRAAAQKYVYCLVPFSDPATNANEQKRKFAWEKHEHFVYGYDSARLSELFVSPVKIAGTYWTKAGGTLRKRLDELSDAEIESQFPDLTAAAEADLINQIPHTLSEALGIKILAKA